MATTLLTLISEVADRLNMDGTIAANKSRIIRWINFSQNDIASRWPFEFEFSRCYVQTQADKTAGTVSVALAGTTVTGVGTSFASGDKRSFIQFSGDTNWYEVTAYTSATSITITPALAGAAISGGTYTLRKVYYDLPTDLFKVFDARQTNTPAKLNALGIWTLDAYQPDINFTGNPVGYYLFNLDPDIAATAAKQTHVAFYPAPDGVYNIEFRYEMILADLSGDTDISFIPQPYLETLLAGAEWLGNKYLNDPKETSLKQAYEFHIGKMIENESANGDYFPVLGSSDTSGGSRFLPFPSGYEQPR